jgi:hypothetical protein
MSTRSPDAPPLPTSHLPPPTSHLPPPTFHLPPPSSQFPVPSSQFPVPSSQFPVPSSQSPVPSSRGLVLRAADSCLSCLFLHPAVHHGPRAACRLPHASQLSRIASLPSGRCGPLAAAIRKFLVRGHAFQAGGQCGSRLADSLSRTVSVGSGGESCCRSVCGARAAGGPSTADGLPSGDRGLCGHGLRSRSGRMPSLRVSGARRVARLRRSA